MILENLDTRCFKDCYEASKIVSLAYQGVFIILGSLGNRKLWKGCSFDSLQEFIAYILHNIYMLLQNCKKKIGFIIDQHMTCDKHITKRKTDESKKRENSIGGTKTKS